MRECHVDRCPGSVEQFAECEKRAAYHEAGHGLLVCLVASGLGEGPQSSLATLTLGIGANGDGGLALPEGSRGTPWHDALVLLGGPASDAVIHGQQPSGSGPDWSRSSRLLQQLDVRVDVADAFAVAEELVRHHRDVLEELADTMARRPIVLGSEVWRLVQASRQEERRR